MASKLKKLVLVKCNHCGKQFQYFADVDEMEKGKVASICPDSACGKKAENKIIKL